MTTSAKTKETPVTHEMVVNLYEQYQYDRIIAIRKASKIQRELTQVEHEVRRIERHLQRIEAFCKKNNVPLENEG